MKVRGLKWQNWKLNDWNEKYWKLEGQFYIFNIDKVPFWNSKIEYDRIMECKCSY